MADRYILDTHALIWFLVGSPKLGANARRVLNDAASALFLPLIALAEACWMVERGKVPTIPSVSDLLAAVDADTRVVVVPLDRPVLDLSLGLTLIGEMHDRQIVATALHLASGGDTVSLLTCDGNIAASGLVPIIW